MQEVACERVGLIELVHDARRFAQAFGSDIASHPLCVYLVALPFAPVNSRLSRMFSDHEKYPYIAGGYQTSWSPLVLAIEGHIGPVFDAAFSPDGKRIVSAGSDKTIRIWDTASGVQVVGPIMGHKSYVTSVVFLPDGKSILSASGDKTIRMWDAASGIELCQPFHGHTDRVTSISISWCGTIVVSGSSDKTLRLWDVASGIEICQPMRGHDDTVECVAFSPDAKYIVSGSKDRTVRLWDATTALALTLPLMGHKGAVNAVAFSPDGSCIVSGSSDASIRLWGASTGELLPSPLHDKWEQINAIAFSSGGAQIVTGSRDNTLRVWDILSCRELSPLKQSIDGEFGMSGPTSKNSIMSLALSPDEKLMVTSSMYGKIHVWDSALGGGGPNEPAGVENYDSYFQYYGPWITAIAISYDESCVATASQHSVISFWDATLGTQLYPPLRKLGSQVDCLQFSPDGRHVLLGSNRGGLSLWNFVTTTPIFSFSKESTGPIACIAFSPDASRIFSGSLRMIDIRDAQTGATLLQIQHEHSQFPSLITFSSDKRLFYSYSTDNICIWDVASSSLLDRVQRDDENFIQVFENMTNNPLQSHLKAVEDAKSFFKIPLVVPERRVEANSENILAYGFATGQLVITRFPVGIMTGSREAADVKIK